MLLLGLLRLEETEIVDVPLVAWVTSRAHALPGSLMDFTTPDERTKQFREFVEKLPTLDRTRAAELAKDLDYQLVEIDEEGKRVPSRHPTTAGRDAIRAIVINTAPARDIILEAPHVPFEAGTAEQAVILFRDLDGVAALVLGSAPLRQQELYGLRRQDGRLHHHGNDDAIWDSDAGHNTQTLFHSRPCHARRSF